MTVESARSATEEDIGRVAGLHRELCRELEGFRGGMVWAARDALPEPVEETLRALLERDDTDVVVGTVDTVIVGFGVARVEDLRDGSRLGVIDELYVEPGGREVGVGEAIVDAVVERCVAAGCRGVDAPALPGHRAAKNFFEDAGFRARALVMHRALETGARGSEEAPPP